jgi:hypothetical protein
LTGGYIITKAVSRLRHQPAFLGCGMLEQGGLSFAILFDFQKAFPFETTMCVVSMALFAIVFNDFLSPFFLKQLLKEGEK